jgi:hypothetical protein
MKYMRILRYLVRVETGGNVDTHSHSYHSLFALMEMPSLMENQRFPTGTWKAYGLPHYHRAF